MENASQPSRLVSSHDEMVFPGQEENYFQVGARALELIQLAQTLCSRESLPRILDLPCGHGRVMRWLRAAFETSHLTACDLNQNGVDFCAQQFDATGVHSRTDLRDLEFDHGFDLIWCGSLLTHLPLDQQEVALNRLIDWTIEDGIIVLSLQGRFMASQMERGDADFADNIDTAGLLGDFRDQGAAYRPYYEDPTGSYGLTLNAPEYVGRLLQQKSNIIVRGYFEQAWGVQDVLILYKKTGFYTSILDR